MKTYAGYSVIKTGSGRHVYVRQDSFGVFSKILKEYRTNYHFMTIFRTVHLLNADAHRGKGLNPAGDAKLVQSGNVSMRYDIYDGAVFIQSIAIARESSRFESGLYTVEFQTDRDEWRPKRKPIETLSNAKTWQSGNSTASYVALPGRFDDIFTASRMMPQHLTGGYQKANKLTDEGGGQEYSLFWNEKGAHKSNESAQSLASIMQQSAKNGVPVNWLVHGESIHTFKNAAKILKTAAKADNVANQYIYFSNPSSSETKNQLEALCKDAGLNYAGLNTNYRDLTRWNTLKNIGMEMGKQLSTATIAGGGVIAVGSAVADKNTGMSSIGKALDGVVNGIAAHDYLLIGAGAFALSVGVFALKNKLQTVAAMGKCTFGRGNDRWYENDKQLLLGR